MGPVPSSSRTTGFSLIELLCVAAILIVLVMLSLGGGLGHRRQTQLANCRNNLRFIHQALGTFAGDHGGKFPAASATTSDVPLSLLVPTHTVRTEIFICPGSGLRALPAAQPFAGRKISYSYAMGLSSAAGADQWVLSDMQVNAWAKTNGQPLFSATGKGIGNNHGTLGGNLIFADGHAGYSGTNADFPVTLPSGVTLLNPRP